MHQRLKTAVGCLDTYIRLITFRPSHHLGRARRSGRHAGIGPSTLSQLETKSAGCLWRSRCWTDPLFFSGDSLQKKKKTVSINVTRRHHYINDAGKIPKLAMQISESSMGSHVALGELVLFTGPFLLCSPCCGVAGRKESVKSSGFCSGAVSNWTSGKLEQISDHSSPLDRTSWFSKSSIILLEVQPQS